MTKRQKTICKKLDYFTTAKEILENDPDAQIFYMEWY